MNYLGPRQDLLGALLRLREGLAQASLALDLPSAKQANAERDAMVDQLEDYVLPRLIQIDAPLLTVVGGSTGAGKSTLVNAIVGNEVSETGVLRPTTRSPVLVHHPTDAAWFEEGRILPDLARTTKADGNRGALQLVADDVIPPGLAILDAPDIDSVEEQNRILAAQLLAAADLWLFVTSAARYADQVPWDFLKAAADRSMAIAVVLDRTDPDTLSEVAGHLARMLSSRGLGDSPLFTVPEADIEEGGMLPDEVVVPIREWLQLLAADAEGRATVVKRTLNGAIQSLARRCRGLATPAEEQEKAAERLRSEVKKSYDQAVRDVSQGMRDGTLLRGEVLARWQEFVGTGEMLKGLEEHVGRIRDRVVTALRGKPPPAQRLTVAVESGLLTLLLEHAEAAAERVEASWRSMQPGQALLEGGVRDLGRASRGFRDKAERMVREWQQDVLQLVANEGGGKRDTARFLAYGVNGLGVALMIVVFSQTAGITGSEIGIAGGTAVLAQKILEAVFGDQAIRQLAERARKDINARVEQLMQQEQARYTILLGANQPAVGQAANLTELARRVEHARIEDGVA
jgi:GTPase SAR1 family protein